MSAIRGMVGLRVLPVACAAGLLAVGIASCTLLFGDQVFSPASRAVTSTVDERTGEIWACAAGGCQLND